VQGPAAGRGGARKRVLAGAGSPASIVPVRAGVCGDRSCGVRGAEAWKFVHRSRESV